MCFLLKHTIPLLGRSPAPLRLGLALLLPCLGALADDVVTIKDREAHQQRVEVVTTWLDESGTTLTETNNYVQIETGLNFRNAKGEWEESRAEFVSENGWAVAQKGQHKVALYHNLNADGAVVLGTPDGKRLRSHVHGLAYYDTATRKSVLIASVKDSEAQQTGDNEVIYPDAFHELAADVRYTYTKSGFEQDIILRERPPAPEKFGFNPETTRLEVWTQFVEANTPAQTPRVLNSDAVSRGTEPPLVDEGLSFGALGIGEGRTFQLDRPDEALGLVAKNWIETETGEKFLVETVAVSTVTTGLEELPAGKGGARLHQPKPGRLHAGYRAPRRDAAKERVQADIHRLDRGRDLAKLHTLSRPGLVLDYVTTNGSLGSYTFRSDETYYFTGAANITGGAAVFEGGTVLKFDAAVGTSLTIGAGSTLTVDGSAYRPVVFTAKDDNSVGKTVVGSTGDPTASYYGATGGSLIVGHGAAATLRHVRFSHQRRGLHFHAAAGLSHTVRHAQFVRCDEAVAPADTVNLHNALFHNVGKVIAGTATTTVNGQHWTVNVATSLRNSSSATINLINTLLVQFANSPIGSYTDPQASVDVIPSSAGLFQTATGGYHYLAPGSPYRNTGKTAIDSTLAADLRILTTDAPMVLTNSVSVDSALAPRANRDTDTPDKGYHYVPLDYVLRQVTVTAALRLTNGVAVAVAGTHGADLQSGAQFLSEGRAENLNRLARWHNVQEQSVAEGTSGGMTRISAHHIPRPMLSLRFTELSALGGTATPFLDNGFDKSFASMTLEFCQARNVGCNLWPSDTSTETVTLRNNLFERSPLSVNHSSSSVNTPLTLDAYNNLFWRGSLQSTYDSGTVNNTWYVRDNLFDGTTQTLNGTSTASVSRSNNGFTSGTSNTYNGSGDRTGLVTDYQSNGNWGYRYYPATGSAPSLATLIDVGSQTRTAAGLFHFTVKTSNNSKEGADASTTVDIGFHYVGLNGSGLPNDTDGDGLPDYVEDRNGDSIANASETNWQTSPNGTTGIPGLLVFTRLE